MKPIFIDWYLPHATHYHTYFFNRICEDGRFSLCVHYFREVLAAYPWKKQAVRKFEARTLQNSLFGLDYRLIWENGIRDSRTAVVAGWAHPTTMILLTLWSLRGIPYFIYTDTPNEQVRTGWKQTLRAWWLNWILRRARGILVTGEWGRNIILGWNLNNRVYNFPFVVDLKTFHPAPSQQDETGGEIRLFSSGRLDINHKGYDVALEALAMIRKEHPDLRVSWQIAGTGPDEARILQIAKELGLEDQLQLLGWKEADELPHLYRNCDVFLHPSRFDPFPNAILEAMACGALVVASDAAGSAVDRIVENRTGFIFKSGAANHLKEDLLKAINLPEEEKASIRRNARAIAEKWTAERNIELLLALCIPGTPLPAESAKHG